MQPGPYRVFICYSHRNADLLGRVRDHLVDLGHTPRFSGTLQGGSPFSLQIRDEIRRAHLFMPLLTRESLKGPWVNQEIGFALASNVPVLPLAVDYVESNGKRGDPLPQGLAQELQAIRIQEDGSDLSRLLNKRAIQSAILRTSRQGAAMYEVAPLVEDRARMLYTAAEWLTGIGEAAKVRQWGTLTSFSLPDADYHDDRWPLCDGCGKQANRGLRRDWRRERQALERHVREAGCDLLIDPHVLDERSPEMRGVRRQVLIDFLEDLQKDPNVRAVVIPPPGPGECARTRGNQTLLGDWFVADSVTPLPGLGYEQTLATWHAPTVMERVHAFDRTFEKYLLDATADGACSTQIAIERLKELSRSSKASRPKAATRDGKPRTVARRRS